MSRLNRLVKSKKGFLLLEILVSIVVIAVGLIYIIRSFSISTRAIGTSRNYILAVSHLEEKLWELDYAGVVESGKDEGYFGEEEKFSWELDAETDEELPINDTRILVSWYEGKRRQRISLNTYLWNEEE